MIKRKASIVIALFLVFALAGCAASFFNKSAATLGAAASVYDVSMTTISDLQKAGVISDTQREQINNVARIYLAALKVADDALIAYNNAVVAYKAAKTDVNQAKVSATQAAVSATISSAISAWADVSNLVNTIKPGTLPATISKSQILHEIRYARMSGGEA